MERRTFLALLSLPAIAELLPACTSSGSTSPTSVGPGTSAGPGTPVTNPSGVASLKGSAPRVTTGADPATAAAAVNAFANDLFARLVQSDPAANSVFSPASIALALAMTTAGAKGTTLAEMDKVLHVTDPAAIHRSMNGLSAHLDSVNKQKDNTAQGGTGTSSVQLSIANSLWGQAGLAFEKAFLDLLSSEYGAGLQTVDYKTSPEAARAAINAWVNAQTHDRIPTLLSPGAITPLTRLTLVNAIYLKANWDTPFTVSQTTKETFTTGAGTAVKVDMMHRTGELSYAKGAGWQAVDLPYVFGDLAFTAAVGDTPSTPLPTGDEIFAGFSTRLVTLGLPKFDIETSVGLGAFLRQMGMPTAFTDAADFTGMTTQEPLQISDVVHQANITLDEKGTEAAAATAVVLAGTAAPTGPPISLVLDRPFTFWLRDTSTDAVVFMGRINDPSATRAK